MTGVSVPIVRVVRCRALAPLLALLLATLAVALLPGGGWAQTPPTWDSDNRISLSSTTVQGTKTLFWPDGFEVPINNQILTIYRANAATSNTQIPGRNGLLLYVKYSGDPSEILSVARNFSGFRMLNSNNQILVTQNNPSWNIQESSDTALGISPTHRLAAAGRVNNAVNLDSAGGSFLLWANFSNISRPGQPTRVSATRSADSTTFSWELFDPVAEYEIEREQAITVEAQQTATTQYGNTKRFLVDGTIAGVDQYVDSTVEARYTYRYRVRARGTANDSWSAFSAWAVSGGQARVNLGAPANLEVSRAEDNASVELSWLPPSGDFDAYAVQRQELVNVEGSAIFANPATLVDDLSDTTLTYTDSSILPGRTYEYRIAALQDGKVGDYSEWFRVSPFNTGLGEAPQNFRLGLNRKLDDRRELWMVWDEVEGVDDYEVEILTFNGVGGGHASDRRVITDPAYFHTAYGRVELRVRARKKDEALCGSGANDRCHTEWTGGYPVQFTPAVRQQEGLPTPMPDASIDEFQDDVDELLNTTLDQSGVDVDPSIAVQFAVLAGTAVLAVVCVVAGWKRGMRPLGVGMGFSVSVISLYLGYRLLGIPAAWPIGAQTIIAIPGIIAFARQLGAFR